MFFLPKKLIFISKTLVLFYPFFPIISFTDNSELRGDDADDGDCLPEADTSICRGRSDPPHLYFSFG
jgi:hypothetical protein